MEIKNLKKTANRILKAIKNKEKIILYGDTDLDGATSVIILKESIRSLGGEICAVYFPNRETEGYGITKKALLCLKKLSPALLIALDCGIGNFKEIKLANEMGFSVIVIDHHKVLDELPEADIIVDPKQEGDNYPFKEFATVGIAFKLSKLLLKKKMTESLEKSFLELTALGTIADMMPKADENKLFIEKGLKTIENSWRPGISVLLGAEFLDQYDLNTKVSKVISMLNVRDVENSLPVSFRVLTSSSSEELKGMVEKLKKKSEERREKINNLVHEVEKRVFQSKDSIIFEGSSDWEYMLISAVASILCRDFEKPTFIYKQLKKESQGTVRSTSDIDSVSLMKKCKEYVITYGGHPRASGFRIKNENIEKFKNCLIEKLCEE